MENIERMEAPFFSKLRRVLAAVPFVEDLLTLYYCMKDPQTPLWAKAAAAAAIAYFIAPVDAVPDAIPVLGFGDDAAVIAATLRQILHAITAGHRAMARAWLGLHTAIA